MKTELYHAVTTYVSCCCFTLSKEQFEEILDTDVKLFHQTNKELPIFAQGKENVSELLKKYVFDNSSEVKLKELNIKVCEDKEDGISLRLVVEETKTNNGIVKGHFLFDEHTHFQFNDTNPPKIISIRMQVERESL